MEQDAIDTKPAKKEAGSFRLILTLGIAGFFSGVILVGVYIGTLPIIKGHKAAALREAIYKVLPGAVAFETLVLKEGQLVLQEGEPAEGADELPVIYAGFGKGEELIGMAIPSEEPGFQDVIAGIFGYAPAEKVIIGFEVLESRETPGLGDKIIKDADFRANFTKLEVEPLIETVKKGEKDSPNEVEAITGATISSKTIVKMMNKSIDQWKGPIEAYLEQRSAGEQQLGNKRD